MSTYAAWITEKSDLAFRLAGGCGGGTYADGAIILCTAINAMASRMWIESEHTDRKRFCEIVARFSDAAHDAKTISLPLLAQDNDKWKQRLPVSDKAFRYTGANDKTEHELLVLLGVRPSGECTRTLRKYSYANLLYADIRCGFAHTYLPTDNAASDDPLRDIFDGDRVQISYVNRLHPRMRQIHFPLEWIAALAKNVANGIDGECGRNNKHIGENIGLTIPSKWWIEGA